MTVSMIEQSRSLYCVIKLNPLLVRSKRASTISFLRDSAALEQSLNVIDRYKTLHKAPNPINIIYRNAYWYAEVSASANMGLRIRPNLMLRLILNEILNR